MNLLVTSRIALIQAVVVAFAGGTNLLVPIFKLALRQGVEPVGILGTDKRQQTNLFRFFQTVLFSSISFRIRPEVVSKTFKEKLNWSKTQFLDWSILTKRIFHLIFLHPRSNGKKFLANRLNNDIIWTKPGKGCKKTSS